MKNFVIFALLASLVQVARSEHFIVDPVNGPYTTILSAIIANGGAPTLDLTLTAGVHNMSIGIELTDGPTERFSMVGAGAENTIITRTTTGTRAFFIRGVDEIFISGVTVTGCVDTDSDTTSRGGGAMFLNVKGNITIENSVFYNNRGRKGGAISLAPFGGNGPTYIRNVTFVENTTPWGGGAVFASGVDVFFESCRFIGNTAGGEGGAVQVYWEEPGSDFSYTFVNSVFSNNTGVDCGGAISSYSAAFGQINLELEGCLFENNVINGVSFASGGAVCMQNAGNFVSYVSTFTGNSVFPGSVPSNYSFGGALWLYNNGNQGSTTILSSKFSNNYARIAAALMLSNRFSYLHTQTSLVLNSEFSGNVADLGSVITLVFTTLSISQTTIQNNQIPADSFALSVEEASSIYLNNTVVTNTTNAGGVYCGSSTIELFRSSIYGNGGSKDILCTDCAWQGLDFDPCSETCTTRDICSACNGNVTCLGDCTTNSIPWSTPCITTTGESTTESVDSSSSLLLSTLLIGIIAGLIVILSV